MCKHKSCLVLICKQRGMAPCGSLVRGIEGRASQDETISMFRIFAGTGGREPLRDYKCSCSRDQLCLKGDGDPSASASWSWGKAAGSGSHGDSGRERHWAFRVTCARFSPVLIRQPSFSTARAKERKGSAVSVSSGILFSVFSASFLCGQPLGFSRA